MGDGRYTGETREIPEQIEAMFKQACKVCATKEQKGQLSGLLNRYQTVFTKDDQDAGRQPPYKLG